MMRMLNNQQIKYCNLSQETEGGVEYSPGVSYEKKLYLKKAIFRKTEKEEAIEYCRSQFLEGQGEIEYLLVEEPTGYTVWEENEGVQRWEESEDEVEQIELEEVVEKMRNIGGIGIKDRRYKLKVYENCFIGSEAVSWFKGNYHLSTEQAVRLGQRLMEEKIIHHVVDEQEFENEFLFYRFYWDEKKS